MSALMQLLIGMSTRRYLPPSGTAGLARSLVRGNRRWPWPPPMMMATTLFEAPRFLLQLTIRQCFLRARRAQWYFASSIEVGTESATVNHPICGSLALQINARHDLIGPSGF